MTNIFPTDYSTKWTPDWTDVVWSSDAVTNFNLTVASIALYTLTNSDTDDLVEWATNLYYTDARVEANTEVIRLENDKEDKSNKSTNMTTDTGSDIKYPSVKAVEDYVDAFSIPDATEAIKWKARIATDSEVMEWIDDTTIVTPLKFNDNTLNIWTTASNEIKQSANTERSDASWNTVKIKEMTIKNSRKWGTVRMSVDAKAVWTLGSNQLRFYKNGLSINVQTVTWTYTTYTYDMPYTEDDLLQIYVRWDNSPIETIFVKNFTINYDYVLYSKIPTVNLD